MTVRCEGCGHPQGEPAPNRLVKHPQGWDRPVAIFANFLRRVGRDPRMWGSVVHWTRCDEGCRHGAPFRWRDPLVSRAWNTDVRPGQAVAQVFAIEPGYDIEASWRRVTADADGTLCTRCRAGQSKD
jgi:hypothetical protein